MSKKLSKCQLMLYTHKQNLITTFVLLLNKYEGWMKEKEAQRKLMSL